MLKKIYNKSNPNDPLLLKCNELKTFKDYMNCIVPGSKIKWRNEKKRYTCIDRSNNFIIVNKPFNLRKDYDGSKVVQYSIFDLTRMKCNRDNLVFGIFNYGNKKDCKEALEWLERALEPFENRFINKNGSFIPKYPDAEHTLEISQRGWCNIEDVIEEIWVEVKRKKGAKQ